MSKDFNSTKGVIIITARIFRYSFGIIDLQTTIITINKLIISLIFLLNLDLEYSYSLYLIMFLKLSDNEKNIKGYFKEKPK